MSQYMSSNNNNNASKGAKIVLYFFELQLNIKLYHWNAETYANHKKYMGAFSRPVLKSGSSIPIQNMSKSKYIKLLKQAQDYLRGDLEKIISKNTELLNIRDEMLGEIDQALYLSTLS